MSWTTVLVAFTVGLLAGTVTGFTGASGVVVVVPLLSLLCGLTVHSAIAASLFVDTLASLTVAYTYFRNGRVEVKDGVMIGLSSIAGAQIGAFIASATPESRISRAFGVFTIALGIMMMRRSRGQGLLSKDFSGITSRLPPTQRVLATVILGFGVGVITGVFGAGGGLMFLLLLVVVLGEPLHKAVGTSTLIMALTAFSGTVGYLVHGFLDVLYSAATSVGSILAGAAASRVANRLPERTLSMVMGLVFLAIGALMILLRGGLS
ncbi:sulfite exporter TauE/SafE family protein [Infirmifilum sp. SLHALR2]